MSDQKKPPVNPLPECDEILGGDLFRLRHHRAGAHRQGAAARRGPGCAGHLHDLHGHPHEHRHPGPGSGAAALYHEPPAGAEPRQLFAACTRISASFMVLLGVAGSVFFAQPLAAAFGLGSAGPGIVPLLFINAALYMLVRYLNVLLRLENDLARLHG